MSVDAVLPKLCRKAKNDVSRHCQANVCRPTRPDRRGDIAQPMSVDRPDPTVRQTCRTSVQHEERLPGYLYRPGREYAEGVLLDDIKINFFYMIN